jgi:hypothetical protein
LHSISILILRLYYMEVHNLTFMHAWHAAYVFSNKSLKGSVKYIKMNAIAN